MMSSELASLADLLPTYYPGADQAFVTRLASCTTYVAAVLIQMLVISVTWDSPEISHSEVELSRL